jgi:hypothetical protein
MIVGLVEWGPEILAGMIIDDINKPLGSKGKIVAICFEALSQGII